MDEAVLGHHNSKDKEIDKCDWGCLRLRHVQASLESNRWNIGVYTIELKKIQNNASYLIAFALIVPANILQKVLSDDLMENTDNAGFPSEKKTCGSRKQNKNSETSCWKKKTVFW